MARHEAVSQVVSPDFVPHPFPCILPSTDVSLIQQGTSASKATSGWNTAELLSMTAVLFLPPSNINRIEY